MLTSDVLAAAILSGDLPPSAAMGRPDAYDAIMRGANGPLPILGTSAKIDAGQGFGILGAVLYMVPANGSGREACAGRTAGCTAACLAEGTGRMSMSGPRTARIRKHAGFYADRGRFLADLSREIAAHERRAIRMGKTAAVRLNGTTDLPWHRMRFTDHDGTTWQRIHDAHPGVRFYEYTKHPLAVAQRRAIPVNLHLTYSISESPASEARAAEYLAAGYSAAVVIHARKHEHPAWWAVGGTIAPMVDGDAHDARFLDPPGSVVALAAKGFAKRDTSGFVRAVPA